PSRMTANSSSNNTPPTPQANPILFNALTTVDVKIAGYYTGKVMRKQVPAPRLDATPTLPPSAVIASFTAARPKPCPDCGETSALVLKPGSNMRCNRNSCGSSLQPLGVRARGSIPRPSSASSIHRRWPSSEPDTDVCVTV